MKANQLTKALLLITAVCALSGCALFNKAEMQYTKTTTIGQELVDLETAKDKGLLSEEEYNKLKKEIMENKPFDEIALKK